MPNQSATFHKLAALLLVSVFLALTACQRQSPDARASEEQVLRQLCDVEWVKATQERDLERSLSFYADDASLLVTNAPIATGKAAIRAVLEREFAAPRSSVSWKTDEVKIARSGDLAYTRGHWQFSIPDSSGKSVSARGKFLVVWQKQQDGAWKVVEDIGNFDEAPKAETDIWKADASSPKP